MIVSADASKLWIASAPIGCAKTKVSAALEPSYQPEDVMAADQSGEDLTVYVY